MFGRIPAGWAFGTRFPHEKCGRAQTNASNTMYSLSPLKIIKK